jgi:hypothetical protein
MFKPTINVNVTKSMNKLVHGANVSISAPAFQAFQAQLSQPALDH